MEPAKEHGVNFLALPIEILTTIFAYLPLEDRKRVRLTSERCYEACTVLSITKNEQFVFEGNNDVMFDDVANFIVNSKRDKINLVFENFSMYTLFPNIWRACGDRMRSLDLRDCRLSDAVVEDMITLCVNLVSLQIEFRADCFKSTSIDALFCSPRVLNNLVRKNVRRSNLRTFEFFFKNQLVPGWMLKNIFLVFPSIKHFRVGPPVYCSRMRKSIIPRPNKYIEHFLRLESLTFNVLSDGNWIKLWNSQTNSETSRLKKLETMLVYQQSLEEPLLTFFNHQKNLRVVTLTVIDGDEDFLKALWLHFAESCPQMEEFHIVNINSETDLTSVTKFNKNIGLIQIQENVSDDEEFVVKIMYLC